MSEGHSEVSIKSQPKEEREKFYNLPSAAANLEYMAKFPKLRFYERPFHT